MGPRGHDGHDGDQGEAGPQGESLGCVCYRARVSGLRVLAPKPLQCMSTAPVAAPFASHAKPFCPSLRAMNR
jgi:hypothetical protein